MRFATRSAFALLAALALCTALACSTLRVSSDYDPSADFSGYRSYAWLPDGPAVTGHARLDSPLVHERVHQSIDRVLASKGFRESAESPDFLVRYDLTAARRIDVTTYDSTFYRGYGYRMSLPETIVREYDEGTLVFDVMDTREKKVVWRGVAQGRLRPETAQLDPAQVQERVDEVVDEVLASFPPRK